MPRGKEIAIPLSRKGIVYKLPYNDVPLDSVYYAENLYYDVSDGGLKTRKGTLPLITLPSGQISCSYLYDNELYIVSNNANNIYVYDNTNKTVNIITPSGINSFGRAKFFQFFQTNQWIVMCDGVNKLIKWKKGDTFATVIANSPVYSDAIVQTSRIIGIDNTNIRLTWSSAYNMDTYPATGYIAIPEAENLIALCPLRFDTSALYTAQGIFLVHSQQGTDATAFRVEKITNKTPTIANRFCVVSAGGVNFYLGNDKKLYIFDGVRITEVAFLRNLLSDVDLANGSPFVKYNSLNDWVVIGWSDIINHKSKLIAYDFRNNICAGYFIYPYEIRDWVYVFVSTGVSWQNVTDIWMTIKGTWEETAVKNSLILSNDKMYFESEIYKDDNKDINVEIVLPPLVSSGDILLENLELFANNASFVSIYLGKTDNLAGSIAYSYLKDIDVATNSNLNLLTDTYARAVFIKCKTTGKFNYYGGRAFVYERPVMQREMV